MNNIGKFAIFLVLLTGLSVFSFADTFLGFSIGSFRLSEQFDNDYGRELDGVNFNIDFNYFPGKFPLGVFVRGSAGASISAYEWTESEMSSLDIFSLTDLRLSVGPIFKIISGPKIAIPISLGPSIATYREEDYYYNASVQETINIGLFADAAVLFIPVRWFYIKAGVSATWEFLQYERRGIKMESRYNFFKDYSYSALDLCIYSGIGIRFE